MPWDRFDALFHPDHRLVAPVPVAVLLLELVPGLIKAEPGAPGYEHTIDYGNGIVARALLHGHVTLGRPTVYDYDSLFAVLRLAATVPVTPRGELVGVTLADIAREQGYRREDMGGEVHRRIKQALLRFSALTIETNIRIDRQKYAAEVRGGTQLPQLPDARPRKLLPRTRTYHVLSFSTAAVEEGAEELSTLTVDPVWLDDSLSGYSAWIDADLHASIAEPYAKRLYEVCVVRATRHPAWEPQEPWIVTLEALLDAMGIPPARRRHRVREFTRGAMARLAALGVLDRVREVEEGRGRYRLELVPGERLLGSRACAGISTLTTPEIARLLWALRQPPWRLSVDEARALVADRAGVVLRVLRRAVYLHESGWHPRHTWSGWIKSAIAGGWEFASDPVYERWLSARLAQAHSVAAGAAPPDRVRLIGAADAGASSPAPQHARLSPEVPDAVSILADGVPRPVEPEVFEDSIWGRVRRRLADAVHDVAYQSWLRPLVLDSAPTTERPQVVLVSPDQFAAEWVAEKYAQPLADAFAAETGYPVRVVVRPDTSRWTRVAGTESA